MENQTIFEELCRVIPGGVNSPVRAFHSMGIPPIVAAQGKGALLFDADGKSYIDYCCSWGPLIHGHCHPAITAAVERQLALGSSFGLTTQVEQQLAAAVVERVPSIEKVRFVSSGTEATMSAVRLARAFTGRELLIKFSGNYHGHADLFLVEAGSSLAHMGISSSPGVPESCVRSTLSLPYNDREAACRALRELPIAAVIVEPVAANMGIVPPEPGFLELLREETAANGALLIFDEVITGFRVARGGAQELYGILPDLTCLGKILGGGFPAAAFGGSSEIMELLAPLGAVFQAGTLSGNPVAMAAGLASLELLDRPGSYEQLEERRRRLTDPVVEALSGKKGVVQAVGSLFTLFFGVERVSNFDEARQCDGALFAKFFRAMVAQGIYPPPSPYETWAVSLAHTEEQLDRTAEAIVSFVKAEL